MAKGAGQPADDGEAEAFPRPDRAAVGGDDAVELHRAKAAGAGGVERVPAHRPREAAALGPGCRDVAAVGDVIAGAELVGGEVVGGDDALARRGDEDRVRRLPPIAAMFTVSKCLSPRERQVSV